MASTIAAVTTSGGGVVTTADASGNLNLLAGTTTVVALTAAGAAVTGTLSNTTGATFATSSGNVGIGTSSPSVKLDVVDATNIYRTLWLNETKTASTRNRTGIVSQSWTGTTPAQILLVDSNTTINDVILGGGYSGAYAATNLIFYTAANNTTVTGAERMRINSSGNVGIGTASPAVTLDVMESAVNSNVMTLGTASGMFSIRASTRSYGLFAGVKYATGDAWMQVGRSDGTPTAYNLLLQPSGGNVGIGTTSPLNFGGANLQVENSTIGSVVWSNGTYIGQLLASAAAEVTIGSRSNHPLRFGTNDTERMRIDSSGNLLVGLTSGNGDAKVSINAGSTDSSPAIDFRKGFGYYNYSASIYKIFY
jgi:hypothetical protein